MTVQLKVYETSTWREAVGIGKVGKDAISKVRPESTCLDK